MLDVAAPPAATALAALFDDEGWTEEQALPLLCGLRLEALLPLIEGRQGSGVAAYRSWIAANPSGPQLFAAWFNLGVELAQARDFGNAVIAYRNALLLKPDLHQAAVNLGLALEAGGQAEAALDAWQQALQPDAARITLLNHRGRLLEMRGALPEAIAALRASLLIDPQQPDVLQHWTHLRQRICAWPILETDIPGLDLEQLCLHAGPLGALALFDDVAMQARIAEAWIGRKVPAAPQRLAPASGYRHQRIRIGYLSSDFCRHAMSFLIVEALERHDRAAFEVFGYCSSPEDGSEIRRRVIAALDHHVPIGALSDEAAARRIRADEIDILIDLNGLTRGARLATLRWKPAPVQATYLGYIGPVPLPELDWMLCDGLVIPPDRAALYAPRPLPLPGLYQANDAQALALPPVSRAAEGLPPDGFVFCNFSHFYKITEAMFDAWMQILRCVPHAVLWLVADNEPGRRNLTEQARRRGIAAERLVFAARVDPARYRARLALADLFLDTTPYNAGTVASDALRMGLPLLTLAGQAFASRMAASLLTAIGLPEGVTTARADYIARAVAVATDPPLHARMRATLAGDAWQRTLGDSAGFTARLEAALRRIRLQP
jgi:predicted O-linked N-acetylglucosamine transferase (SPINDLY family)